MVEENILNLSRQALLVPYDSINQYTIKVFGVGSVGSHVVKILGKTGFKNLEVYDMDEVSEENISAQAFDFKHIGIKKTEAIKDIVKEGCGVDVIVHDGLVSKDSKINVGGNIIYCCFFDSFEARKMLFNKLKDFPIIFVDARIGMYNMRHYLVNCANDEEVKVYEESLETTAVSELACGEKSCAPVNSIIAGKIVMNIINFIKGNDYSKIYIGNAENPLTDISIMKTKKVLNIKDDEENIVVDDTEYDDNNDGSDSEEEYDDYEEEED